MSNFKILHIASFNGNIGDNANHNGFRNRLEKVIEKKVIYTNLEMREFYHSWGIRNFNDEEFINYCNEFDLVVIGGGNFFELKWEYSDTGTTININSETIKKIKTKILFHGIGLDVGKGSNEETIKKFKNFLINIVENENIIISLRNDGSFKTLQELFGNQFNDKIIHVPDGAFFMEVDNQNYIECIEDKKYLGINVAYDMKEIRFSEKSKEDISYKEFIKKFANQLNTFLEKNENYNLIFFPHIYSDLLAIYNVIEEMYDPFRRLRITIASCVTGQNLEQYTFGLYNKCDCILGMRFHANVCAIAQNIPTIPLSSYKKINDLYEELELVDRIVNVNKVGFDKELELLLVDTITSNSEIRSKYKEINNRIYDESCDFYNTIKNWI